MPSAHIWIKQFNPNYNCQKIEPNI